MFKKKGILSTIGEKPIVTIDPYSLKSYIYKKSLFEKSTSKELAKNNFFISYVQTKDIISSTVDIARSIAGEDLRDAIEKLQLNDASLTFEPETSMALGFGFRCGFLGLLHMEIIQERLEREYDLDLITTVPNVIYKIVLKDGSVIEIDNPAKMPPIQDVAHIEEPYVEARIMTPSEYLGNVMKAAIERRGIQQNMEYIGENRVEITFLMPLGEIIFDFFDKLKSITS